MNGLRPQWRGLDTEDLRCALQKDLRRKLGMFATEKGGKAAMSLETHLELAEMRLQDRGEPLTLRGLDPRLPYYRPPLAFASVLMMLPLDLRETEISAYEVLMECANAGFLVGYESSRGRWLQKPAPRVPFWRRLIGRQDALMARCVDASWGLQKDIREHQNIVVQKVGVDPPWLAESRLPLSIVGCIMILVNVDPSLDRLSGIVYYTLRSAALIGAMLASGAWPPPRATADELSRLDERVERSVEEGRRGMHGRLSAE